MGIRVVAARAIAVLGVSASAAMVAGRTFGNSPFLKQPGAEAAVWGTYLLLCLYGGALLWVPNRTFARPAFTTSAAPGFCSGLLLILHLFIERFIDFGVVVNGRITLLGAFFLWAVGGYQAARATGMISTSAVAGAWSGALGVICMVVVGFALDLYWAVPDPKSVVAWAEYQRSGWTEPGVFTIYNALDSAETALVIGGVGGAVLGTLAGLIRSRSNRGKPQAGQ